jgi:O-acetyl-ADP-ribose deacetylase (regulator of RNase III)
MERQMRARVNDVTIQIVRSDVFLLPVAALVNATGTELTLPPALAAKAGPEVIAECKRIGWCEVGSAVITDGGHSGFQKIIHAVGPRWGEGSERGKLVGATRESLQLAETHALKSIAIPAISTGAAGYPLENCATTLLTQIIDFTFEELSHLREVYVYLDSQVALEIFQAEFQRQIEELREAGEGRIQV